MEKSTSTILGEMNAWCRGINELYNLVQNINLHFPRPFVRVDNVFGAVDIYAGHDRLFTIPNWDLETLRTVTDHLSVLCDFTWSMYKAFIS